MSQNAKIAFNFLLDFKRHRTPPLLSELKQQVYIAAIEIQPVLVHNMNEKGKLYFWLKPKTENCIFEY